MSKDAFFYSHPRFALSVSTELFIIGWLFVTFVCLLSLSDVCYAELNPDESSGDGLTDLDVFADISLSCSGVHYCCAIGRNTYDEPINMTINLSTSGYYSYVVITNAEVNETTHETNEYCVNSSGMPNRYGLWTCFAEVEYDGDTSNDEDIGSIDYCDCHECDHDETVCHVYKYFLSRVCEEDSEPNYIRVEVQFSNMMDGEHYNITGVNMSYSFPEDFAGDPSEYYNYSLEVSEGIYYLYLPAIQGEYDVDVNFSNTDLSECDDIEFQDGTKEFKITIDESDLSLCTHPTECPIDPENISIIRPDGCMVSDSTCLCIDITYNEEPFDMDGASLIAVSYTHLTLPTKA